MRALVVGATGVIGRRVAAELARSPEVEHLVVTARSERAAGDLAGRLGTSPRIYAAGLDVADTQSAEEAFRTVDVVASCAGPAHRLEVGAVAAALGAPCSYVSLCDDHVATEKVLTLDTVATERGVTVVSGCGLGPGITDLLVAIAARELDEVEEIGISVAGSSADALGGGPAESLLLSLAQQAPSISDGETTLARAGQAPRLVYFPPPVGWVETFVCGHPEVVTLARTYPGISSLGFRIGLTEKAAMDVARALALRPPGRRRGRSRGKHARALVRRGLEALSRGPAWTSARVDVRGPAGGHKETVSLAVVDHLVNLASLPLISATLAVGSTKVRSGVVTADEALAGAGFLEGSRRRGLRIARLGAASL